MIAVAAGLVLLGAIGAVWAWAALVEEMRLAEESQHVDLGSVEVSEDAS